MRSENRFWAVGSALVVAMVVASCGGDASGSGGGTGGMGGTASQTGGTAGAGGTPSGGSGGSAGDTDGGGTDALAAQDDASDAVEEPVPCGDEKQVCCGDTTCIGGAFTCADHFCLVCNAIPTLSPGCNDVARGVVPTALETNPGNPLASATDGSSCTAWGSGDFADLSGDAPSGTWFQLDLGSQQSIDSMTLWMAQSPYEAMVTMRLEGSNDGASWVALHDPADFTMLLHANDPWLTRLHDSQDKPVSLRYFKITFLASPSWISIREIGLYACGLTTGP